ncbi:MAG: DUF6773 family protein [Desulfitobacteriaceae bacterium]
MLNKRNSNEHFDEMQVQTRNKVGNQCFFILYYLLMINLLLTDYGVKWAASPLSMLVIMLLCMGYYLTRIVWVGAYVSQRTENRKHIFLIVGLLTAMTTIIAIIRKTNFFKESFNILDGGFLRLVIFFFVFFSIIVASTIISRRKSNAGNE